MPAIATLDANQANARLAVAIFGELDHTLSASSISGVAIGIEKQRDVKVGFAGANLKRNLDKRVEAAHSLRAEIGGGVEGQAVKALNQGFAFGKELEAAAVRVGLLQGNLPPCARGLPKIQADGNCGSGSAMSGIQNVGRDAIHIPSHFLRRSCVI